VLMIQFTKMSKRKEESKVKTSKSKAQRPFPGQHQGETVQLVFRQHPVIMRKTFMLAMVIILIGMMPLLAWSSTPLISSQGFYDFGVKVALLAPLGAFIIMLYRWIGWFYSVYIVTDERIVEIRQKGFFDRKVTEFGLDKVQNVNYHISGFQGALFQFGDITAQTYVGDLVMQHIHKPVRIHEQIVEVVRQFNASLRS
jgi:hypothetical protein